MPLAPYTPTVLPERQPGRTLLDVAHVVREGDGIDRHAFAAGVAFGVSPSGLPNLLDPNGPIVRDEGEAVADPAAAGTFIIDVGAVQRADQADRAGLVAGIRDRLETLTPFAVERHLWDGSGYTTPANVAHVALTAGVVDGEGGSTAPTSLNGGTAFDAGDGLDGILDGIAATGDTAVRVIHAIASVVNGWVRSREVEPDAGGLLRTVVGGHLVVPGAGYTGTSPANAAPAAGTSWVYVTHRPAVWLGEPEVLTDPGQAHARNGRTAEGHVRVWAQREAIVAFDPANHLAALVTK